jgi:hypothetical protein
VTLDVGVYRLEVNAYADENYDQLLFSGTAALITIEERKTTSVEITLQPVLEGGTGTFRWNITLPDSVISAVMEIRQKGSGTLAGSIPLNTEKTGARELPSGFYDVTIIMKGETPLGEMPVTRKEILHIYNGRESLYEKTFTDINFNIVYTVIFQLGGYNHTDKFVHGSGVSADYFDDDILKNLPDDAYLCAGDSLSIVPSYTVEGLYSIEDGPTEVDWDMQDDVFIGDITLYARLGGPIDVSKSAGDTNFEKIVNFINSITTTNNASYTLFIAGEVNLTQSLTINNGVTLTVTSAGITDSTINRGIPQTEANSGLFVVQGALILQNIIIDGMKDDPQFSANAAPLVRVSGGTFTMNDGAVLRNNQADYGGGVYVNSGTFTMTGGIISDNEASSGGGVFVVGIFAMSDGTISGNNVEYNGGGVNIEEVGEFTMTGGEISDNIANNGGGVYPNKTHMFTMTGGIMSGNIATTNGGGVHASSGGCILGGEAIIKENYNGNVSLLSSSYIRIVTPFTGLAEIWVTSGLNHNGVIVESGAESGDVQYFHADDEANSFIIFDNGKLVLKTATAGLDYTPINSDGDVVAVEQATAYRVRKGTVTSGDVIIPANYNGLPVTEIGSASDDSTSGAFANANITAVYIPATVTSIGSSAFYRCRYLVTVTFAADSLLTSIGDSAFYVCTSLTSVTIPAGVTNVGNSAFSTCTSLTSITIPAGVTTIGNNAFEFSGLETIIFAENSQLQTIGNATFNACESLISVTIPANVTIIGVDAFSTCTSLTSITFPAGLTEISDSAFYDCASLTSITIPASVTNVGSGTFSNCTILAGITVEPANANYLSEGGVLYNKTKTVIVAFPGNKTEIIIPVGVTEIGLSAFQGTKLITITFEADSQLQTINRQAFSDCKSLTSITIPAGIERINMSAFSGCTNLATVTCLATTRPTLATGVFPSSTQIKVPADSVDDYKAASNWSTYAGQISAIED